MQLGDMVLRMACEQVNQWRHEHPALAHLGVAVNISSAQLRSDDAVRNMTAIVEGTGLPFSALILELTESVLMDERTGSVSKLVALRSLGVRLAVDDFGTGYSSLLYLRRYPLDMLKIDRSFVAGLVDNHEDATIVDAVVRLGHSFGLQTVAEGVETAEQLQAVPRPGLRHGAGPFLGTALAARDIVEPATGRGGSPAYSAVALWSPARYGVSHAQKVDSARPNHRRRVHGGQEAAGCLTLVLSSPRPAPMVPAGGTGQRAD